PHSGEWAVARHRRLAQMCAQPARVHELCSISSSGDKCMFAQQHYDRRRFVGMAALSLAAAWIGTRDSVINLLTVKPFQLSGTSDLASLGRATAWLNSAPLTAADLQDKVVLVDFWTYTC